MSQPGGRDRSQGPSQGFPGQNPADPDNAPVEETADPYQKATFVGTPEDIAAALSKDPEALGAHLEAAQAERHTPSAEDSGIGAWSPESRQAEESGEYVPGQATVVQPSEWDESGGIDPGGLQDAATRVAGFDEMAKLTDPFAQEDAIPEHAETRRVEGLEDVAKQAMEERLEKMRQEASNTPFGGGGGGLETAATVVTDSAEWMEREEAAHRATDMDRPISVADPEEGSGLTPVRTLPGAGGEPFNPFQAPAAVPPPDPGRQLTGSMPIEHGQLGLNAGPIQPGAAGLHSGTGQQLAGSPSPFDGAEPQPFQQGHPGAAAGPFQQGHPGAAAGPFQQGHPGADAGPSQQGHPGAAAGPFQQGHPGAAAGPSPQDQPPAQAQAVPQTLAQDGPAFAQSQPAFQQPGQQAPPAGAAFFENQAGGSQPGVEMPPGAPAPGAGSHAAPLPSEGSHAAPLPGEGSHAAPLPGAGSHAAPLPGEGSHAAPLPGEGSHAAPLPGAGSHGAPVPAVAQGQAPSPWDQHQVSVAPEAPRPSDATEVDMTKPLPPPVAGPGVGAAQASGPDPMAHAQNMGPPPMEIPYGSKPKGRRRALWIILIVGVISIGLAFGGTYFYLNYLR